MSDKLDQVILAAVELVKYFESGEVVISRKRMEKRRQKERGLTYYESAAAMASMKRLVMAVEQLALLPGEPIFCMRGKDLDAPMAIQRWLVEAERSGAGVETLAKAGVRYQSFLDWQNENFRHVKVPT